MQIGIFARTFNRPTLSELLDAVAGAGLQSVQFNFSCVGLPTLPEQIDAQLTRQIRRELDSRKLSLAAVSGTFNMVHPDERARRDGLRRLLLLVAACADMGAPVVTLCTGTRDPDNMWRRHLENDSSAAWRDLLWGLGHAAIIAEAKGITLGIEPEPGNVVSSARKARLLLNELKSPRVKIVMDAANLMQVENMTKMRQVLDNAFELLGRDLILAHAKDVKIEGTFRHVAAGKGVMDYDYYLSLLKRCGYDGPLILHELAESEVAESVAFVRRKLNAATVQN